MKTNQFPTRRFLTNTAALFTSKGIALVTGAINATLLASSLGISVYGEFAAIFSILGITSIIAEYGLDQLFISESSGVSEELKKRILRDFFLVRIILILVFFLVIFFVQALFPFSQEVKRGLLLAIPIYIFTYLGTTIMSYFQSKLILVSSAFADAAGRLITTVILTSSFFLNVLTLPSAIFANILGNAATFSLMLIFLFRDRFRLPQLPVKPLVLSRIVIQSFPIALVAFLNQVFFRIDIPLQSQMISSHEVGLYAFAYKLFELSGYPASLIMASFFPILSNLRNTMHFRQLLKKAMLILIVASILIFSIILVGFPVAVGVILPLVKYRAAFPLVTILFLALPFLYIQTLYSSTCIIHGKEYKLISIYFIAAVINIILNLVFIPTYGSMASATITVVTQVFVATSLVWEERNFLI